jgi:hypothetical protein
LADGEAVTPIPGAGRIEQFAQAVAERAVSLVMESIDMDALLARVDVDAVIRRVDVEDVISRVDVDAIVRRVDVEEIIDRVDVDAIVQRVDIEKLLDRVDVEQLIDRVDVRKIVDRIDVEALVAQTELGTIIARSTSGVAAEVLDAVRAQGVGLDDFVARWVNRVLRRKMEDLPVGPPRLVGAGVPSATGVASGPRAVLDPAPASESPEVGS